ncbi:tRNA (guanosine(37)-N1)-methyltransferase TrmD [Isachenkonia alkalipeptolytica]|uniref:tRNA (guanine-N(1)-)-methyltransferase n=1 Tax=Isachenkonia alkalipeptolytica TaxID=2565777 RepID=A0AA43XNK9_9CLOT|nr:tRNA (guanosine(37)-N1)-methyltransferase TrmD [Isachenkonia alkalipeptolytica]NBG89691.1 tRNA (guanosine(37)-N1)-methyltransferase TrmD [Isachenkonia alkalipeptolytica]
MKIHVMTLFPEMFSGPLGSSIIKRAREDQKLSIEYYQIRDYSANKHQKVDDYPYGGGSGMVMTPQPIVDAYRDILKNTGRENPRTIYLSPKGKAFTQEMAMELSREPELIFLCGHYEGVDQRVIDKIVTDEISIGDYVLTGGELPAMVMIDAVSRLLPGVLSSPEAYQEESIYSGLLEYPQYTRPQNFEGREVPKVLLSGDHEKIRKWRRRESLLITRERRPDLFQKIALTKEDYKLLKP